MAASAYGNFHGKRLVVFGCGYVGSAVARQAVGRGLAVTALTRNEAKAIGLREDGIEVVVADLASAEWHARIAPGAEFVLNAVSSGGGGIDGYRHSYVEGMRSIVAWTRSREVNTLIYTSSTSVYPQDGGAVVAENAPTGGDDRTRVLLEAEELLRHAKGACGRWFILRLAGIYGPARHHLLSQLKTGEIAGRGEHRLNLAHRDDIAAAIWACFASPLALGNEIFNVADDAPARKADVVNWLAEQTGAPFPRFTGEPAHGRRAITPDRVISNEKLKSVLGWRPQFPTFREGYRSLLSH